MDEVKLTPEEEAIVNGEDVEDEPVVDEFGNVEEVEAPTIGVPSEGTDEPSLGTEEAEPLSEEDMSQRVDYAERANKGLLKEIKKLRDNNRSYRNQWNELQARLAGIEEKLDPEEEKADDPEPSREEAPLDWLLWKQKQATGEQLDEALAPQKEAQVQAEAAQLEAKKDAIIHDIASSSEAEAFGDSDDSEKFEYSVKMNQMRDAQFSELVGRGMPEQQAYATVITNEREFIEEALQEGSNPALKALEIYNKQGMKLTDYEPWVEYSKEQSANGEEQPKETPPTSQKIEAVRKGQKASGMADLGGSARKTVITYDQLASMDADDPIAAEIYGSEKKLSEISITGKTSINN